MWCYLHTYLSFEVDLESLPTKKGYTYEILNWDDISKFVLPILGKTTIQVITAPFPKETNYWMRRIFIKQNTLVRVASQLLSIQALLSVEIAS